MAFQDQSKMDNTTWPGKRKLTLISANGLSRFVWLTYPRPAVCIDWFFDTFRFRMCDRNHVLRNTGAYAGR